MNVTETLSVLWIRWLKNPVFREMPVDFSDHLRSAGKILILGPEAESLQAHSKSFSRFLQLFPKGTAVLMLPGLTAEEPGQKSIELLIDHPLTFSEVRKQTLWQISRSDRIRSLAKDSFTALIDLDPQFRLLSAYLCRSLYPPVRIAFAKPKSEAFFNLRFDTGTTPDLGRKIENLTRFLSPLLRGNPGQDFQ